MNRYDALAEKSEIAVVPSRGTRCKSAALHTALDDFTACLTWFKKATDAAKTAPDAIERLLAEHSPRLADTEECDVLAAKSEVQPLCDRIVEAKNERDFSQR